MAIITRLSRLFQADAHAVLDLLEEPDVLLRHSVREMEQAVADEAAAIKRLRGQRQRTSNQLTELRSALEQTDQELDLCFANDKDELARTFVRRKLELAASIRTVEQRGQELERRLEDREASHRVNQARLDGIREKAELVLDRGAESVDRASPPAGVSEEDVEVALLREKQRRAAK